MIQVTGISKRYQSGRGMVNALSDVSFSIGSGRMLAVAGKSGSGKTTLLNCVGGLEAPDAGTVNCFGTDIHALGRRGLSLFQRRDIGFVFQSGNLLSYLTVFENIAFPLHLNRIPAGERDRRVRELLEKIGLPSAAAAAPYELSGGELQRVAFARAIAHSPRLLLADEPTASLDSETARELVRLMTEIGRDQGCTMIISTHDPEIVRLGDETLTLRDGRVRQESA
jgi:putative ABC transport system ATP-binding protein